jgi:hypothetical protein
MNKARSRKQAVKRRRADGARGEGGREAAAEGRGVPAKELKKRAEKFMKSMS